MENGNEIKRNNYSLNNKITYLVVTSTSVFVTNNAHAPTRVGNIQFQLACSRAAGCIHKFFLHLQLFKQFCHITSRTYLQIEFVKLFERKVC